MRKRSALPGAALTAFALTVSTLSAQPCPPGEVTEWRPRSFRAAAPTAAAERASMESVLRATEAIVRATAYGKPLGFTVTPTWQHGDAPGEGRLRRYEFWTMISHDCSRYDESGSDITIIFNPDPQRWSESDRPMPDEKGDALYTERVRSDPLFGSTATFGRFEQENTEGLFVLFTTGVSPTVPVSREEFLRAQIFQLEGKDQAQLKEALEHASKTQYQRWLESAAERKKQNEQIVAGVASVDPSRAAKVRADLEKADREAGEAHKKSEPQERAELEKVRANVTAAGDKIRAQIAAMTPAERASPAWLRGFDLVPAGTANAHAIVRANPEFYRPRQSPVEVRAILVHMHNVPKARSAHHQQMFREFDWAALNRLLSR